MATFGATVAAEDCGGVPAITDSSPPTAGSSSPWFLVAREEEELPPDCFEPFGQNIAWRVLAFRPCFCVKHATHWPAAVSSFLTMFALSDNFPVLYICFVTPSSPPPPPLGGPGGRGPGGPGGLPGGPPVPPSGTLGVGGPGGPGGPPGRKSYARRVPGGGGNSCVGSRLDTALSRCQSDAASLPSTLQRMAELNDDDLVDYEEVPSMHMHKPRNEHTHSGVVAFPTSLTPCASQDEAAEESKPQDEVKK